MSIKIMAEVWDNAAVRGGELTFLLALADQADDDHRCAWPGMGVLQQRSRASRATVYRYAESMQDQQIIERCPEEEYPGHYRRRGGRETIVWRFRPVSEWLSGDDAIHSVDKGSQFETGVTSETPGVSSVRPEPPTTPTRKNNSSTTSKSRSSQRASARRGDEMDDPVDQVFAKEQDDSDPDTINPRGGPDSAWGLNKHYRDSVRVAGNGFLGNTNDKAMRGFFAAAKRQGVKPDVLRAMVDEFVGDERLFTKATGGARWRVFIANAESLRQRVAVARSIGRVADFSKVPEFGGSIPQHILDEILAEVG